MEEEPSHESDIILMSYIEDLLNAQQQFSRLLISQFTQFISPQFISRYA